MGWGRDLNWVEHVPEALAVTNRDGCIIAANQPFAEFVGGRAIGVPLSEILPSCAPGRSEARRLNGVPVAVDVAERVIGNGRRVVTLRPIEPIADVSRSGLLLDAAFENAPIGMAFFNSDGEYIRVNAALCKMLERDAAWLIGRRDQELTHPDHREEEVAAAWRILNGEIDTWQGEKRFLRPCGTSLWVIANLTFIRDDGGRPLAWLGQFQDITPRQRLEQELRTMADQDPLTGLANRRRLVHELTRALDTGGRGCLLMLDLDGFKNVNDTFGHVAGDQVLETVAEALRKRLRRNDVLARLGGDEFAAILLDSTEENAASAAAVLTRTVRDLTLPVPARLCASVGIAEFDGTSGDTPATVLDRADRSMYRVKAAARAA